MQDYDYDLRKLQLVEAKMLEDLKGICERNNIRYYLTSGTLLGAVRHKGFIPWDNDIDVEMPYEDYIRFVTLPQEEIGSKYFVQTTDTEAGWDRPYARIRLNNTTMMYDHQINYKINHGIWIDIFPLIEINDGFELKFKRLLLKLTKMFNKQEAYEAGKYIELMRTGKSPKTICDFIYRVLPKKLRRRWAKKINHFICKAKNKKNYSHIWCDINKPTSKSLYEGEPVMLEFEGELFPVAPKYDQWLTARYGDYMTPPPEKDRVTHDGLMVDFDNSYEKYMDYSLHK